MFLIVTHRPPGTPALLSAAPSGPGAVWTDTDAASLRRRWRTADVRVKPVRPSSRTWKKLRSSWRENTLQPDVSCKC
jgi:hypothetical protein